MRFQDNKIIALGTLLKVIHKQPTHSLAFYFAVPEMIHEQHTHHYGMQIQNTDYTAPFYLQNTCTDNFKTKIATM